MGSVSGDSLVSTFKGSCVWWLLAICLSNGMQFATAMPNPPVKLTASDITPSSLKLAWKSGNAENVQSYIIQYKLKHDPGDYRQIIGIQDTEYTIEHMLAYQQYELRVIAVTKLGRSAPSAPIEIVTGELGLYYIIEVCMKISSLNGGGSLNNTYNPFAY